MEEYDRNNKFDLGDPNPDKGFAVNELLDMSDHIDGSANRWGQTFTVPLDHEVLKAAFEIVMLLEEKINVSTRVYRQNDGSIRIARSADHGIPESYAAIVGCLIDGKDSNPKHKFTGIKLIHTLWCDDDIWGQSMEPPKILSEETRELGLSQRIETARFLNQCRENHIYKPLGYREIIDELKKFRYGETKLTPLQHAYLHLLFDMMKQATDIAEKHKIKIKPKHEYFDENLKRFQDLQDKYNLFAETRAKLPEYRSLYEDPKPYSEEDCYLGEYEIGELLDFCLDYIEQVAKDIEDHNSSIENELLEAEIRGFDAFDDYDDKPDWLGGMETEEEFWEHE